MNKDQVTGKLDQVSGRIKQTVGEAVGDQHLANKGAAQQVKGAAKETWGNVKDAAQEEATLDQRDAEVEANRSRESFVDKVANLKDKVNDKIDDHKERVRNERRSA